MKAKRLRIGVAGAVIGAGMIVSAPTSASASYAPCGSWKSTPQAIVTGAGAPVNLRWKVHINNCSGVSIRRKVDIGIGGDGGCYAVPPRTEQLREFVLAWPSYVRNVVAC